jgi:F-type H+-transporting ATPase subunit b
MAEPIEPALGQNQSSRRDRDRCGVLGLSAIDLHQCRPEIPVRVKIMAETTAHTEVPGGHAVFPPFDTQQFPSQLFWLSVTFVLLYVVMAKVALPRIGSIFEERDKIVSDDLAEAERFKEKSNAANAAYQQSLADAHAHAQSIVDTMRKQQAVAAEKSNKELEEELRVRLAAAEATITKTRQAAMTHTAEIAAEAAAAIVERLLGIAPNTEEIARALREVRKRTEGSTGA